MSCRFARILFVGLVFFVLAGRAPAREVMSLDGVWNFATDPDSRGETEKWYQPNTKLPPMPLPGYAPGANGTIQVPGIWDNQGYGAETDRVRHNFTGKGWYKRQIEIPASWAGQHVFLLITGSSRYAKAWVDDQFLGEHIGHLSPAEYDITKYVTPGRLATITIQVDSKQRWEIDAMYGCSFLADDIDTPWGGIWGHVVLEARSDVWLSDLYLRPDVPHSSCAASAILKGKADLADGAKLEVFDKSGRRAGEATIKTDPDAVTGQPVEVKVSLPNAELWTPDNPTLYTAQLSVLKGDKVVDSVESRFGMRQFTIDGYRLLLNGKRIMLRGYGDDHIYPKEMAMSSDKNVHLSRLRTIKSYGFDHVRHHSTIMPPEYYDACDEAGIITTAEFCICYAPWLPGSGQVWKSHVPSGTNPAPAMDTYLHEWEAVIKRNRNHPSIICWVMGNELWDAVSLQRDFQRIARQYDPARFFLDADGVGMEMFDPKHDRDTLDYYAMQFDDRGNPSPAKFKTPQPKKPVISHEAGNYLTFSRPDLIDQFRDNIKPYWLTASQAKLEQLGLTQEAKQWALNSERLYALCHKINLESLRLNPYLSGYHWWLFQDYWTTSNGLVDHYFRPKSITKEEVLNINNDVVLLQQGLDVTYRGKSPLKMKLLVSNFSPGSLQGKLTCEVKVSEQLLVAPKPSVKAVPQGEVAEAGQIALELPDTNAPAKLCIKVELAAGEERYTNDWTSWLYPATIKPAALPIPVFADKTQIERFPDWGLRLIPAEGALSDRGVYVSSRLADRRLVDALERGASLVLLDSEDCGLKSSPITFRTSWWKGGYENQVNHTGTLVYDHPLTRAMAPEGWCDGGWFYLIEAALRYDLESGPARPDVIIRGLPTIDPVKDQALLFEVGVGKGCLIVSGLNHRGAAGRPENAWLMARLLEHAAFRPKPKSQWPASLLSAACAAAANRVPGFQRLISNGGDEAKWRSYREDDATTYVCCQTRTGTAITWQTAPVPADLPGDHATFVFAGGLGSSSAPKNEGYSLTIDGNDRLRFDVPAPWESPRWKSADTRVELRFVGVRRTTGGDPVGLFYLTVSKDLLKLGEPCRLEVRSLGTRGPQWFALNPYHDVN